MENGQKILPHVTQDVKNFFAYTITTHLFFLYPKSTNIYNALKVNLGKLGPVVGRKILAHRARKNKREFQLF